MTNKRTSIQAKSDEKRGIAKNGYSPTTDLIKSLSQGTVIAKAIELYAQSIKPD